MDKHYILRKKEKENIVKNPVHTQDIVPGEGIVVNRQLLIGLCVISTFT